MTPDDPVADLGGLAEASVEILVVLSGGAAHGYAIKTAVERETGRTLGPGTLYTALARLEERGLIEPLPTTTGGSPTGSPGAARRC